MTLDAAAWINLTDLLFERIESASTMFTITFPSLHGLRTNESQSVILNPDRGTHGVDVGILVGGPDGQFQ